MCHRENDFGFDESTMRYYDNYNHDEEALYCPDIPQEDKIEIYGNKATSKQVTLSFQVYRCDRYYQDDPSMKCANTTAIDEYIRDLEVEGKVIQESIDFPHRPNIGEKSTEYQKADLYHGLLDKDYLKK